MARPLRTRTRLVIALVAVLALVAAGVIVFVTRTAPADDPCGQHLRSSSVEAQRAYTQCRQEQLGEVRPSSERTDRPVESAATKILGTTRSGLPWHSGAWLGGRFSTARINDFGTWRGTPADVVTTYSAKSSYEAMMKETWPITVWQGFAGRLNYGLALVPEDGEGTLATIAAGEHDAVWRTVAQNLKSNGRGNSIVRAGWESNLQDWPWQATAENAEDYKGAFRRVVTTMRAVAPDLVFEFGVGCGSGLTGSEDRLAPLTAVYPGDDVVDLIGCDTYDWYQTQASSDADWGSVLLPSRGPGIEDVAEFARARGKGASFAEWGLAKRTGSNNGGGDNPYYIESMFNFFTVNSDVVAFESYFDEPDPYIANSLYGTEQNPKSAAVYRRLW